MFTCSTSKQSETVLLIECGRLTGRRSSFEHPPGCAQSKPMGAAVHGRLLRRHPAISPAQSHRTAPHWRRHDARRKASSTSTCSRSPAIPRRVRSSRVQPSRVARSFLQMAAGWPTYRTSPVSFEVYLRRYPGPEGRWTVSTGGGTSPLWNPTGNELFYRNGNKMMAVSISTTPDATLATPRVIFERPYAYGSTVALTNYDVSADGQRFLMVKRESAVAHLSVVLNWFSELTRLAPGGSR